MKKRELATFTDDFVTAVTCDITGRECPNIQWQPEKDRPDFDYAELRYSGGYGSAFDLMDLSMDIHPEVAFALFLLSERGKSRAEHLPKPKYRITIEEIL